MENLKGTIWVVFNSYAKLLLKTCQIFLKKCFMSLVTTLTTDQSQIDLLEKAIKIRNRYGTPRLDKKDPMWRKRNYKVVEQFSQADPVALLWDVQSDATRTLWATAGAVAGLTGYQLFFQDISFRLANDLPGIPIPNTLHQYKVLEIVTGDGYQEWAVYQFHYQNHLELQRQIGKKNATRWVEIEEGVPNDITFSFNYYSQMTWASDPEEYYAYVWIEGEKESGYDIEYHTFDLELFTGWQHFEENILTDFVSIYGYEIGFHSVGAQGTLLVDDFSFVYDSQDYAIDHNCDRVDEKFIDNGDGPDYAWWVNYDVGFERVDSLYLD